jgi:hypothetical protein
MYLPLQIPVERHLAAEASHVSSDGEIPRDVRHAMHFCNDPSQLLPVPQPGMVSAKPVTEHHHGTQFHHGEGNRQGKKAAPFSSLPKQRTRQGGVGSAPSYAMIAAMMEIDYWRTRCVGEAIDQGYAFLSLTCECGRITDYPFTMLLQRRGVRRGYLHWQHRVSLSKMRKCGAQDRRSLPDQCTWIFESVT